MSPVTHYTLRRNNASIMKIRFCPNCSGAHLPHSPFASVPILLSDHICPSACLQEMYIRKLVCLDPIVSMPNKLLQCPFTSIIRKSIVCSRASNIVVPGPIILSQSPNCNRAYLTYSAHSMQSLTKSYHVN